MSFLLSIPELLEATLFALAHVAGGLGGAIVTVSIVIRLGLLPLTLFVARRSAERRRQLAHLEPALAALKKRFRKDPRKLMEATSALLAKHGVKAIDRAVIVASVVQLPIVLTVFTAVRRIAPAGGRFLWIADLGRPDVLLALLAAGITWLSVVLNPGLGEQQRAFAVWLPTVLTLVFLWRMAAALGLYWAASSAVGVVQSVLLRSERKI